MTALCSAIIHKMCLAYVLASYAVVLLLADFYSKGGAPCRSMWQQVQDAMKVSCWLFMYSSFVLLLICSSGPSATEQNLQWKVCACCWLG